MMPDIITEADIAWDEPLSAAELDDLEEDWREESRYWAEVRECCGGTDWDCAHYRHYPPPVGWDE